MYKICMNCGKNMTYRRRNALSENVLLVEGRLKLSIRKKK